MSRPAKIDQARGRHGASPRTQAASRWFYRALEVSPAAYCRYQSRFADRHPVSKDTDVVIEGYPGSANTFAREAFLVANPGLDVASHLHSAAQLKLARALRVPTVVAVRPPLDAIVSVTARFHLPDLGSELRRYRAFYECHLEDPRGAVVAPFEVITTSFGPVIEQVNERFGTSFRAFADDEESRDLVARIIAAYSKAVFEEAASTRQAIPAPGGRPAAGRIRAELTGSRYAGALRRCEALYAAVLGTC